MKPNYFVSRGLVLALGILLNACAAPSPRAERVSNSFAWFDMVTDQGAVARSFYSSLFGWRFGAADADGYQIISAGGELIGGLSPIGGSSPDVPESQWVAVLSVDDVTASSRTVKQRGGKVVAGPLQTSDGNFALVRDNSRAALTLYDGTQGFPLGATVKENTWVWVDLFTDKSSSAKSFYRSLSGFETNRTQSSSGETYTVFMSGSQPRGGLVQTRRSDIEPNWLPYVFVSDLDDTLSKAVKLGGGVLAREGVSAIIVDPTGAAIGVTERTGDAQ